MKQLTWKNLIASICSLLTVLLICQELYRYVVVRPTTTSKEEKGLRSSDIPETVVCADPGFASDVLKKYGYKVLTYYRGSMDGENFVGWNGRKNESKSAHDILEEALIVDHHFNSLFTDIYYTKDGVSGRIDAETEFRTLSFPLGRCIVILPPNDSPHKNLNSLAIWVNKTEVDVRNVSRLLVFFMDRVNSVGIYPNDLEMLGDQVWFDVRQIDLKVKVMKTKISKFIHVPGDPLLDCAVYTESASFGQCVRKELLTDFKRELGCVPPLLNENPESICNKTFTVSDTMSTKVKAMFKPLFFHNKEFKCKTPCTNTVFNSKFMHSSPTKWENEMALYVAFDKRVDIRVSLKIFFSFLRPGHLTPTAYMCEESKTPVARL